MSPPDLQAPQDIDVSLSQGITITWRDGHVSHYAIKYLREHCPCATCTGAHGAAPTPPATVALSGANPLQVFKPTGATLRALEPVGRYAVQLHFSDDHNTGIFTWEYLRELCPCCIQRRSTS